ncbi:hypothetical protein ACFYP4_02290 [Streptomyces sp. NPDC005551]|uniref:hypothetical protein n=1 Tax=Streptomyces sp. NPDC005551 TaxID=3364725 RepID=UPI0036890C8A
MQETTAVEVSLPAFIVRGLISGEAMVNNDSESTDMQVVSCLKAASYKKVGPGEQAVLRADHKLLDHLADYLFSLTGPGSEVLGVHDRFGFSRSQATEAIARIERQLAA